MQSNIKILTVRPALEHKNKTNGVHQKPIKEKKKQKLMLSIHPAPQHH